MFAAWTTCTGDDWYIGASVGGVTALRFVWSDVSSSLPRTPGLDVVQFLQLTPTSPPVIVVSTGTGYNWD